MAESNYNFTCEVFIGGRKVEGTQLETDVELRERLSVSLAPRLSVQQMEMIETAQGNALDTLARAFAGLERRSGLPRDRHIVGRAVCDSAPDGTVDVEFPEPLAFTWQKQDQDKRTREVARLACDLLLERHGPMRPFTAAGLNDSMRRLAIRRGIDPERLTGADFIGGEVRFGVLGEVSSLDFTALEQHLLSLIPLACTGRVVVRPAPQPPDHAGAAYRARRGWTR